MLNSSIKSKLKQIVGDKYITDDPVELYCYSHDNVSRALSWVSEDYDLQADVVIKPSDADQIKEIIDIANEESLKIIPRGAGTSYGGQFLPIEGGIILDLARMNKIKEINTDDYYAVVEPGILYKDLGIKLKNSGKGYWIPCNPGSADICSIGGMISNDASGESVIKYGTTKDYVLKLDVVLGSGKCIQIGNLVKKTVSGLDLLSLFVGSEGTLGIITEATLKFLPLPESFLTVVGYFNSIESAVNAAKEVRDTLTPMSLELVDGVTIMGMNLFLSNLNAKFKLKNSTTALLIRLDGDEETTTRQGEIVRKILFSNKESTEIVILKEEDHDLLWNARNEAGPSIGRLAPLGKNVGTFMPAVMDFSVPFSKIQTLMERYAEIMAANNLGFIRMGHLGDGNVHLIGSIGITSEDDVKKMSNVQKEVIDLAISLGGSVTAEHGCGIWKAPYLNQEHGSEVIELMKKTKLVFDPNNVLNPGKLYSVPQKLEIFSKEK